MAGSLAVCRDCGLRSLFASIGALESLRNIELSAGPGALDDEEDRRLLPSSVSRLSQLERLVVQGSFERTEAEQLQHAARCTALTRLSLSCPPSGMPLRDSGALCCLSALQRLQASLLQQCMQPCRWYAHAPSRAKLHPSVPPSSWRLQVLQLAHQQLERMPPVTWALPALQLEPEQRF